MAKWRASFDFGVEAGDFFVEIVGDRIDGDADSEIVAPPSVLPDQSVP